MKEKIIECIHVFNTVRPMQWIMLVFTLIITWDFHLFYKENFFMFEEWQNAGVLAYAAMVVGIMKIVGDGVMKKRERDD